MKAIILAAGRGTRLAPLTDHTPKPLLPVQGKPLIEWQIERLVEAGIVNIAINLHHLGDQIESHLGDGSQWGAALTYSRETELLETGGAMVKLLPYFEHAPFVVMNGDIWTDFDFRSLPATPSDNNLAHLVLTPKPTWRRHGDFDFDGSRVTSQGEAVVYCGIAVVDPRALEGRRVQPFSFRDIMFELMAAARLGGQLHQGIWHDIGTLAQYEAAQHEPIR